MDASIGSDPNDSQATQLLNDLLQNETDSSRKQSDAHSLKSSLVHSNEISSDSLPSPQHSNPLPQYHFHGLAATQTQSQHYAQEEEVNEGWKKDNIGAQRYGQDAERPSPPAGNTSKGAQCTETYTEITIVNSHRGPANKKSSSPTLQMQFPKKTPSSSPSKKPTTRSSLLKPQMSRFNPYRRPHSRSDSQDSFACDPSDKPELQFLAKSDKFALPLSELGKHSFPTRGPSNGTTPSHTRDSRSPPTGRILVDATPSHSGSSLNDEVSQRLEATQLVEDVSSENRRVIDETIVDKEGSGYESSEPSSSYHRFLDGARDTDMQATQPSTQVDDPSANVFSEKAIPWSNVRSVPASSEPNSLMSMVAPHKRWRYRQPHSIQASNSVQPPISVWGSINHDAITTSSFPPPPFFPSKSFSPPNASNSRNSPPRVRPRPPSPVPPDTMDVVPDSEPVVEENVRPIAPRVQRHVQDGPLPPLSDCVVGESDVDMDVPDQLRTTIAQRREEEEDEEEEIPLAALARQAPQNQAHGKHSTKSKTPVVIPAPNKASTRAASAIPVPAVKGKKGTPSISKPQSKAGRSWENTVVPSSVPEQDITSERRTLRKAKAEKPAAPKGRPVRAPPPRSRNQRGSRRTTAPSTTNTKQASVVDESDDELLMQPSDCDGTEPADDEYILDEDDVDSKKRKRSGTAPASTQNTRAATKRGKRSAQTPDPRPKRLRTVSTASRVNLEEATRVFALWKQDHHYYPGVIHSDAGNSDYVVKFDDDTEGRVTLDQMRLCRLQVGDNVLIANRFRPSLVTNVRDEEGEVYVELDGEDKALHISSLRIANKTILYDWNDRILSHHTIVPVVKPVKPHLSPSPSKLSMFSVPSFRGGRKKLLARTGLIVTLTATKGNWEKEKEKVMNAVKNSGGIVVDDLNAIIRMEGKHSHSGNAWIITKMDVEWIGDEEIERLFLVADEPNQKPKFLIALALGIPCLDTNWLRDSVEAGEEKDWLAYLLPQGHSEALDARPTQQVDIDWGNSSHHLTKIMSNAVPSKLFAKKSILCVGGGMVPLPKGRRKAGVEEKTQEAMNALPRIILAMGAETVEAVTESRYASRECHDYDYIIIREQSDYSPEFVGCTTVTWTWVKESLTASRCLPLPVWPSAQYSQEA